jgi:sugar phosphate permease
VPPPHRRAPRLCGTLRECLAEERACLHRGLRVRRFVPSSATVDLRRWQSVTGVALLVGYSGYYLCRSNLSVIVPALVADPTAAVDRETLGWIASAGIVAYAAGKSINGVVGDFLGGRTLFLTGLFLSVAATLAFSASAGVPLFTLCWVANRFVLASAGRERCARPCVAARSRRVGARRFA